MKILVIGGGGREHAVVRQLYAEGATSFTVRRETAALGLWQPAWISLPPMWTPWWPLHR